ncbi:hypothetical protein CKAN_02024800 [Cinnamomum micranthum f. kanehirae]|uniref:Uncharacterized protein n=1 Tax=Cinnamomum micranthum f. kanehirae TaxID=337451 RepID=A0A443PK33_9MAGN|nr:hypothetical protein CKAN_02024800 [Cinnamomum micranthum f. kanehirae]
MHKIIPCKTSSQEECPNFHVRRSYSQKSEKHHKVSPTKTYLGRMTCQNHTIGQSSISEQGSHFSSPWHPNMNPYSDFSIGMAKILGSDQTQGSSIGIAGTLSLLENRNPSLRVYRGRSRRTATYSRLPDFPCRRFASLLHPDVVLFTTASSCCGS